MMRTQLLDALGLLVRACRLGARTPKVMKLLAVLHRQVCFTGRYTRVLRSITYCYDR